MTTGHIVLTLNLEIMKNVIKTVFALAITLLATSLVAQEKTKKVHAFSVERVINAPVQDVWKVVGEDFGAIANSHPQIVSSNYVQGTITYGEGAKRVCNFNEKGTKYVEEEQTSFDPANYTFIVKMYHANGIPMDPNSTYAIYKVIPIDENSSKLVISLGIRTKPAFMGAIAKGKFKQTMADYTLAVEHHVLTGENVNKENFKEIKKQYKS